MGADPRVVGQSLAPSGRGSQPWLCLRVRVSLLLCFLSLGAGPVLGRRGQTICVFVLGGCPHWTQQDVACCTLEGCRDRERGSQPASGLELGVACWVLDLSPTPQLIPFHTMSFSLPYFCQERKLQDLEVDLTTRTKDVKARRAQLDVQVREGV